MVFGIMAGGCNGRRTHDPCRDDVFFEVEEQNESDTERDTRVSFTLKHQLGCYVNLSVLEVKGS